MLIIITWQVRKRPDPNAPGTHVLHTETLIRPTCQRIVFFFYDQTTATDTTPFVIAIACRHHQPCLRPHRLARLAHCETLEARERKGGGTRARRPATETTKTQYLPANEKSVAVDGNNLAPLHTTSLANTGGQWRTETLPPPPPPRISMLRLRAGALHRCKIVSIQSEGQY